jgi:hypothetical protein
VDGLELGWCELAFQSLVHFHIVGSLLGAFLKEPDDALGAGLLEPGFG